MVLLPLLNLISIILFIAAIIFKAAIFQKFNSFDAETLSLLIQFIVQKLDDSAVVLEAIAILSLFSEKNVLSEKELFSTCIK